MSDYTEGIAHIVRSDRTLADVIAKIGPCKLSLRTGSVFESLVRAIAHQQLTGKAANTILRRLEEALGTEGSLAPEAVLRADIEVLRRVGFSLAKASYIREAARAVTSGAIPSKAAMRKMPDEEIIQKLTAVKGIGRWSAEMFLIFDLGRLNVLPLGDYGVRKGFAIAYGMKTLPRPRTIVRRSKHWHPYRTLACWYLWRVVDMKPVG
jgi:3-methyladenine DNA glycosylase/8-oxoguanine DNA glycosylase